MSAPGAMGRDLRVLVVDDDPAIQRILQSVLADLGLTFIAAETAADAEAVLASGPVEFLILDLFLPDADGRVLLRKLRSDASTAALPVLVLTGRSSEEVAAECFEMGAQGFIQKPFDPKALSAEVKDQLERLAGRASDPPAQGAGALLDLAGCLEAIRAKAGTRRGLVVAELDGTRALWSRHGRTTTEAILSEVGTALARALPDRALARTSGNEFAVVLGDMDPEAVRPLARRILEEIRGVTVEGPDGETFRLTASVGFTVDEGRSEPSRFLDAARDLVERAAAAGGNRIWDPESVRSDPDEGALVLVAEDDDITARILTHRLEKDGFRVLRFQDGNEAYRRALDETPALVMLDVKMPGMDGFEILSRLRRTPSYDRVPIVMLTSMGSESDVVRGFGLGADEYILKPFSPGELVARLRRLLRRGHTPA